MTYDFPSAPSVGVPMKPAQASQAARDLLALRRSAGKRALNSPGPAPAQLDRLLEIAARVPDHRRLGPWRFIVFEGDAREHFNQAAVNIQTHEDPDASHQMLADTASYFSRAPVVIAVISSPDTAHKTPVWEQQLSAGAVCLNLLLAANASGWAGCWLTEWIAYSRGINALLNLSDTERVAGYIYLGTATEPPQERMRPDIDGKIRRWTPVGEERQ